MSEDDVFFSQKEVNLHSKREPEKAFTKTITFYDENWADLNELAEALARETGGRINKSTTVRTAIHYALDNLRSDKEGLKASYNKCRRK